MGRSEASITVHTPFRGKQLEDQISEEILPLVAAQRQAGVDDASPIALRVPTIETLVEIRAKAMSVGDIASFARSPQALAELLDVPDQEARAIAAWALRTLMAGKAGSVNISGNATVNYGGDLVAGNQIKPGDSIRTQRGTAANVANIQAGAQVGQFASGSNISQVNSGSNTGTQVAVGTNISQNGETTSYVIPEDAFIFGDTTESIKKQGIVVVNGTVAADIEANVIIVLGGGQVLGQMIAEKVIVAEGGFASKFGLRVRVTS